ncbi:hypothetical protein AYK26_02920 [Euryarchaeota archaeon SM23-78]|nr:MAG: hypothetical protein AYK26_02920 [Euryarchaeota archaeon SM23-78]MBW3000395.1 hypothetical protein [Candidatus Woesearchaeota archaeon]
MVSFIKTLPEIILLLVPFIGILIYTFYTGSFHLRRYIRYGTHKNLVFGALTMLISLILVFFLIAIIISMVGVLKA